jgi:hypothetical protein
VTLHRALGKTKFMATQIKAWQVANDVLRALNTTLEDRSAELFRAGRKIERVHSLNVRGGVLAHCHHIDGAARTRGQIYNRRSRNSDFRNNLVAAARIGGRFAASEHRSTPQYRSEIRVTAINGIVLCGNYHYVMRAAVGNRDVGYNEGWASTFPSTLI